MEKILEDVKQYYSKRAMILPPIYLCIAIIALYFCEEGKNSLVLIAGVMLFLLVATTIHYYRLDKRIERGECLFILRKICRVYKHNQKKKYKSLKLALYKYEVEELKMIQVDLKVNKENDKKYGMVVYLPICVGIAALVGSFIPSPERFNSNEDTPFLIMLIIMLFVILVTSLKVVFNYNTDDYILICIEDIINDKEHLSIRLS